MAMNTDGEHKKGGEDDDEDDAAAAAEIESQYEKYRDDQMNTGVIAALIGGFALTNSWEMGVEVEDYDPNVIIETVETRNLSVIAYVLAICAVHACTCSALVSAFLYRNLTRMKSPQDAVQWVHRHPILIETPFYKAGNFISCTIISQLRIVFYLVHSSSKVILTCCVQMHLTSKNRCMYRFFVVYYSTQFLMGVLLYLASVILVAWETLEFNTTCRIFTVVVGIVGCTTVLVTCYIILSDNKDWATTTTAITSPTTAPSLSDNSSGVQKSSSASSTTKKVPNSLLKKRLYKY